MAWLRDGWTVTVGWHVFAGGRWRMEELAAGATAPVNVYVTETRMAPVMYRHQAGECKGQCVLTCGHPLVYGCDCDTIAVEACQGDDVRPVLRLVCSRCGDVQPDADVMGEGVSLGALCGYVGCGGVYRDM